MSCETCNYSEERMKSFEKLVVKNIEEVKELTSEVKTLSELGIRNDERNKITFETIQNTSAEVKDIKETLNKYITKLAVNDVITNQSKSFIDKLTPTNMLGIIVALIAIITAIKS